MVIMVIIRADGRIIPILTPHGEMAQWPTVREAREHFDIYKLHHVGECKVIGLPTKDEP
jgi:hypothetical protein